jgi:serine/threonine-protein kinase
MSPEQSLGSDHADGRSDIYSMGCVLYELLVGQPPFDGPNSRAIMARHSMEQVPSLQVVRQSVPDELEDVVLQALEKTPADRFQTMAEFAEVLADLEPTLATRRTSSRGVQAVRRTPSRVTRGGVSSVEAPAPAVTTTTTRITPFSKAKGIRFWSAAGLIVLLAAGVGVWRVRSHGGGEADTAAASATSNRIAVLYFDHQPGADSLGYLADGLTETLIRELGRVSQLQVISSNGVRPYRDGKTPTEEISKTLNVGSIVQGKIDQSGNRLRVSVSLSNAATGTEIGSTTLERPREEIFALQDDLAKEVSIFLRKQLGAEVQLQESRAGTRDPAAWEQFQKAQEEAQDAERLVATGDSLAVLKQFGRADSLLARVEKLDPKWVAPVAARSWLAYRVSRLAGSFDKVYYDRWTELGLSHAKRALQLDPKDPDALEAQGTLEYWRWLLNLEPDAARARQLFADAERDLRAAVDANPTQASAWSSLSHLLINKEETGQAKLAALKAYEADPYLTNANVTIYRLFSTSLDLEDAVEARHWCDEGGRRFPDDPRFVECRIWAGLLPGQKPDISEAWQQVSRYVELSPLALRPFRQLRIQMLVAGVLARAGLKDSARAVILRSRADASTDPTREIAQLEAVARTILGDKQEAIEQLSLWLATNPQLRGSIAEDKTWWFKDLQKEPGYRALFGVGK